MELYNSVMLNVKRWMEHSNQKKEVKNTFLQKAEIKQLSFLNRAHPWKTHPTPPPTATSSSLDSSWLSVLVEERKSNMVERVI